VGFDYLSIDMQHGLIDYTTMLHDLMALDAVGCAAVVRVPSNDSAMIGRALDAGARGIIVPLVNTREEAAEAVAACRYPPHGIRSHGPTRSILRIGPDLREADREVACIAMIETAAGLENAWDICHTPGLDAVYIGPADLSLALGAESPAPECRPTAFEAAVATVRAAAADAGIAVGMHCNSGAIAADALADGFTFASVSCDIEHLTAYASAERNAATTAGAQRP
jgi:4-hydroxy-2-oxoheptanedioate aldolase